MALSPDCIEQHKKEQAISRTGLGWGLCCAVGFYGALIPLLSSHPTPLEQVELESIELVVVAADEAVSLTEPRPDESFSPGPAAAEQAEQPKELPEAKAAEKPEPLPEPLGSQPASEALETSEDAKKPEESETLENPENPENTAEPESSEALSETAETAEPESPEALSETAETAEKPETLPEAAGSEAVEPETASTTEESKPAENIETTAAIATPSSPANNSADNGAGQRGESPTGSRGTDAVMVGRASAPIEERAREQGAGGQGNSRIGTGSDMGVPSTQPPGTQASGTQTSTHGAGGTGRSRPANTRQFGCRGARGCFQPDYPDVARRAGVEGTPVVYYDVDEDGYVINVRLATSSGNAALDRAAQEAVKQYRFTSGGAGQTRAVSIDFSLEGSERNRAAQQRGEQRTIEEPIQPAPGIESARTPRVETTPETAPATAPATAPETAPATTEQTTEATTGTAVNRAATAPETVAEPLVDEASSDIAPQVDVGPGEDSEALTIPTDKPQSITQPTPQPEQQQPASQAAPPQAAPSPPAPVPMPEVSPQPIPTPAEPAPEVLPPAPEPPLVSPQGAEPGSNS